MNTVLISYHRANARLVRLLLRSGWACVHLSSRMAVPAAVFVRDTEEARPLIERFGTEPPPLDRSL